MWQRENQVRTGVYARKFNYLNRKVNCARSAQKHSAGRKMKRHDADFSEPFDQSGPPFLSFTSFFVLRCTADWRVRLSEDASGSGTFRKVTLFKFIGFELVLETSLGTVELNCWQLAVSRVSPYEYERNQELNDERM